MKLERQEFALLDLGSANGTFVNVSQFVGGTQTSLYAQNRTSSAIQQGLNQSNLVTIVIQSTTINIFINGQHVDVATEPALTDSMRQGVVDLSATFTNAILWTM